MTKNFTYEEMIESATARRLKISNEPTQQDKRNIEKLCEDILQPIRDKIEVPIIVDSGYRSTALNKIIGGSATSQHITGAAADIRIMPATGESQKQANQRLFNFIKSMVINNEIKVGQLIDEYNYSWIHVSLPSYKHINDIRHLS